MSKTSLALGSWLPIPGVISLFGVGLKSNSRAGGYHRGVCATTAPLGLLWQVSLAVAHRSHGWAGLMVTFSLLEACMMPSSTIKARLWGGVRGGGGSLSGQIQFHVLWACFLKILGTVSSAVGTCLLPLRGNQG